jgi:hypothetical protein
MAMNTAKSTLACFPKKDAVRFIPFAALETFSSSNCKIPIFRDGSPFTKQR